MNRPQRIVLILYCLLLAYCCVWIPWHSHMSPALSHGYADSYIRLGYGWLWIGSLDIGGYAAYATATPDLPLIQLRLIAATAIGVAAFLLAGIRRMSSTRS